MTYVSARQDNNSITLKLNADRLDASIANTLKSEILDQVASTSANCVVIDLASVTFIDSSGLGALVSIRKNIPSGHDMQLRNTNEFVRKVFKLTKMDRVFTF